MGTFRARFTFLSSTGSAFTVAGAGDEKNYSYLNSSKTGTINFHLTGSCFFLDGSVVGIPFASLPSGFTVTGLSSLTSPNVFGGGFIGETQASLTSTAAESLTYGTYGPVTISSTGGVFDSFGITDIPFTNPVSLLSILAIQATTIFNAASTIALIYDTIDIEGTYTNLAFTFTFPDDGASVSPGAIVTLTSVGPPTGLDFTQLTLSVTCGVIVPITQTTTSISFAVPAACNGNGVTTLTATGNGVQFSGSVALGTLNILLVNGSGIYHLVTGQRHDQLYSDLRDGTTVNYKIPNPVAKTGFVGG